MKPLLIAPMLAVVLALAGPACTDDNEAPVSPTVPATPPGDQSPTPRPVPGAFFGTDIGVAGRMIEGTKCWGNGCVDMVGPVTLPEPVAIGSTVGIDLLFEGGQPDEIRFAWVDVDGVTPKPGAGGTVAWVVPVFDYEGGDAIATPGEAGDYVLTVFARWDGAGDVTFSTYFRVS